MSPRRSARNYLFFCRRVLILSSAGIVLYETQMAELTDSLSFHSKMEEEGASIDEVRAAIESLSEGELLRLERYAKYRIRGLGGRVLGRDHEDLFREAIAATLGGDRRWKRRKVDFFTHLVGVMRSLSSHWNERERTVGMVNESEFETDSGRYSPLTTASSSAPGADRVLEAQQELARIERHFASDANVLKIMVGLKDGMTGPEIQVASNLNRQDYESALKRMRRGIERLSQGEAS
jgi:hypothetical protein